MTEKRAGVRRRAAALLLVAASTATLFTSGAPAAVAVEQPWMNTSLSADQRADLVLQRLTLTQKTNLLIQSGGPGIPEYGIPAIRGIDGCCGSFSSTTATTALPVGLALASSFDTDLAQAYGKVSGSEARANGYNALAGPTMDLARTPYSGRLWESQGEDPMLLGDIAAAQTRGEQSAGVTAIAKHYLLNNHESRRAHVDVQVDERTLQEVYLRSWETEVKEGQPGAVMCSFNEVAGEHACSNSHLLTDLLKDQLGFSGYVSSDYDAAHGYADYAAGLDVAGPGWQISGPNLQAAVERGEVPAARVDDAARRVLRSMFAQGIVDNPPAGSFTNPQPAPQAIPAATLQANGAVAEQVADASAVLLKNTGTLPLTSRTTSIAVIGADADAYIDGGGSGAIVNPANLTTVLDGITARAGKNVKVEQAAGTDPVSLADTLPGPAPVPSSALSDVQAQYWAGADGSSGTYIDPSAFAGAPQLARTEKQINLRTGLSADAINTSQVAPLGFPLALQPISARWTAKLTAPATGTYGLSLSHLGTARLYVDGVEVVADAGTTYGTHTAQVPLVAGRTYDIRVEYTTDAPNQFDGVFNDQAGAMLRLGWTLPSGTVPTNIQQAVEVARRSEVAVVVARDYTGEASDRGSLSLPQDQDRLIEAVAAVNPRTVVVLATSGPVTMPWLGKVSGVVETWYAGQAQGKSIARVLYGDVNPSGKLPVTFPASDAQPAQIGTKNPFETVTQLNPTVSYDEGVNVGYRGYQAKGVTPLFPFGHGLSYTTFGYEKAQTKDFKTKDPSKPAQVKLQLTNTGKVSGTEVVQVYVGKLPTTVETPTRALAGYARVTLEPGKKKNVTVDLDTRSLQYWDAATDSWVTPKGKVPVYVGTSSGDIRLTAVLDVM
ncbi:beta-glucosidase [Kineococcus glutinatus]|uniref:Glycoside hydrolase family 3 C-terminal domain-containing protein n=1 Tax=Kineococcus glutinatus TaxID=1070872 RepID=A0ABP9H9T1_9ACTN